MIALPKILLVEDDVIIAEDTKLMLQDMGLGITGKARSAQKAIESIESVRPDLILLDIEIEGEMDGISLAQMINEQYNIPFIYLTSYYDDRTLSRARETFPQAYVLKPFDEKDIKVAIQMSIFKARERLKLRKDKSPFEHKLFVKKKGSMFPVSLKEIRYFQSNDNYCYIQLDKESYMVLQKLKDFHIKYQSLGFFQVHRSYLVNFHYITQITEDHIYLEQHKVPIGKTYRKSFLERLTVV